jgi:hypothetical protein
MNHYIGVLASLRANSRASWSYLCLGCYTRTRNHCASVRRIFTRGESTPDFIFLKSKKHTHTCKRGKFDQILIWFVKLIKSNQILYCLLPRRSWFSLVWTQSVFYKNLIFLFKINYFFMFLDCFYVFISKINF